MYLFLVFLCCSTAVAGGSNPNILGNNSRNSRLGVFNSRLGPQKFPFSRYGNWLARA